MKILKGSLTVLIASSLMISCKQTSNEQTEASTENTKIEQAVSEEIAGTVQKASFQIEGMACAIGCAKVIEKKLADLDGVQLASVDFETKSAIVEFDDAKQNTESIVKTVETIANGAYSVEELSFTEE